MYIGADFLSLGPLGFLMAASQYFESSKETFCCCVSFISAGVCEVTLLCVCMFF